MHRVEHYPDADALHVELSEELPVHGRHLDDSRILHIGASGKVVAFDLLYVSDGVNLDGLPIEEPSELRQWLAERNIRVA